MNEKIEKKRKQEQVDGMYGASPPPDYETEASTVGDDLRVMLDGYTPEDVAFALLRPRDPIKDSM